MIQPNNYMHGTPNRIDFIKVVNRVLFTFLCSSGTRYITTTASVSTCSIINNNNGGQLPKPTPHRANLVRPGVYILCQPSQW